jgi:rubrerythrin
MKQLGTLLIVGMICLFGAAPRTVFGQDATKDNVASAASDSTPPLKGEALLKNLHSSYYTEVHEHELYLEFGKKADEEGYHQVASMFRAVARAEAIHAANKAELIQAMGGVPKENTTPLLVQSTRSNLELAVASETVEQDVMYSGFIKQAKLDKNKSVEQTFVYSLATETGHLALFKQALKDLESYRGDNVTFYVCPHCGQVARTLKGNSCPVCSDPRDKFEAVR